MQSTYGQTFRSDEGVIIGSLDGAGNLVWEVDPATAAPDLRAAVAQICKSHKLREMVKVPR